MGEAAIKQSLVLGRYLLGTRIGVGTSGSVFRATDSQGDHDVVVKFTSCGRWCLRGRVVVPCDEHWWRERP